MLGQLRIIHGRYLKIRWAGKNSNMGAYKISWGLEKIEGEKLLGAVTEGCVSDLNQHLFELKQCQKKITRFKNQLCEPTYSLQSIANNM